jgi:hypothetical protein
MRASEFVIEKWSTKYKRSINCNNPQGFSQKAHCAGRRKNEDLNEFAPDDSDNNGQEDLFFKYAKLWYNGNLEVQQRIEEVLAQAGWEIGKLESEEGGAFIVQSGDENGDTYMGWSKQQLAQINELTFLGSPCTKDCSGHRAGYEWSRKKGGVDAASWSRSFNNGAALFKNGY